jgi:hypothetical protein
MRIRVSLQSRQRPSGGFTFLAGMMEKWEILTEALDWVNSWERESFSSFLIHVHSHYKSWKRNQAAQTGGLGRLQNGAEKGTKLVRLTQSVSSTRSAGTNMKNGNDGTSWQDPSVHVIPRQLSGVRCWLYHGESHSGGTNVNSVRPTEDNGI